MAANCIPTAKKADPCRLRREMLGKRFGPRGRKGLHRDLAVLIRLRQEVEFLGWQYANFFQQVCQPSDVAGTKTGTEKINLVLLTAIIM